MRRLSREDHGSCPPTAAAPAEQRKKTTAPPLPAVPIQEVPLEPCPELPPVARPGSFRRGVLRGVMRRVRELFGPTRFFFQSDVAGSRLREQGTAISDDGVSSQQQ